MKKWFFLFFVLIPSLSIAGFLVGTVTDPASVGPVDTPESVGGVDSDYSAECLLGYDHGETQDGTFPFGQYLGKAFGGGKYTPSSNQCVCAVDVYFGGTQGTLTSSDDIYIRIATLNGSNEINSPTTGLGTSSKIDGDTITDHTWISANIGVVTFSPCIELSSGTAYAIYGLLDEDGNTATVDNDSSNYPRMGMAIETDHGSIWGGRFQWEDDGTVNVSDAPDDVGIRIYTE
jgi:hypothetical protein